jgi:hypothetical protein
MGRYSYMGANIALFSYMEYSVFFLAKKLRHFLFKHVTVINHRNDRFLSRVVISLIDCLTSPGSR